MAKINVAETWTLEELRKQLDKSLDDWRKTKSNQHSNEFAKADLWYRIVANEYCRRGMESEWKETLATFRLKHGRKDAGTQPENK